MTYCEGKVVVGYDGSRSAQAALDWAAIDAAERGRELLVLHAAGGTAGEGPEGAARRSPAQQEALLIEGLARIRRVAPDLPVTLEITLSGVDRALVRTSGGAEKVVLGLGTGSDAVVAQARCPVVVVDPDES